MSHQEDVITERIKKAIFILHIPQDLQEDAFQEGRLAICKGENLRTALKQWFRKEKSYREREIPTDPHIMDNWEITDNRERLQADNKRQADFMALAKRELRNVFTVQDN